MVGKENDAVKLSIFVGLRAKADFCGLRIIVPLTHKPYDCQIILMYNYRKVPDQRADMSYVLVNHRICTHSDYIHPGNMK